MRIIKEEVQDIPEATEELTEDMAEFDNDNDEDDDEYEYVVVADQAIQCNLDEDELSQTSECEDNVDEGNSGVLIPERETEDMQSSEEHQMTNIEENCTAETMYKEGSKIKSNKRKGMQKKKKCVLMDNCFGFKKEVADYLLNEYILAQWPAPYRMQFFANECNRLFNCSPKITLEDVKKWFSSKRRSDRTRLTYEQLRYFKSVYKTNKIPNTVERQEIASTLGIPVRKVSRWFYKMRLNEGINNKEENRNNGQLEFTKDGKLKKFIFNDEQKAALLALYEKERYPSKPTVEKFSQHHMIPETTIKSWFVSRRFKERTEKRYFSKKESNTAGIVTSVPEISQDSHMETAAVPVTTEISKIKAKLPNCGVTKRPKKDSLSENKSPPFSTSQIETLQSFLKRLQVPNASTMKALAADFGVEYSVIENWFRNHLNKDNKIINAEGWRRNRSLLTDRQRNALEALYNENRYPTKKVLFRIAAELGLSLEKVNIYFKNKRVKGKKVTKGKKGERMVINQKQRSTLREFYENNSEPSSLELLSFSKSVGLPVRRVSQWFIRERAQNMKAILDTYGCLSSEVNASTSQTANLAENENGQFLCNDEDQSTEQILNSQRSESGFFHQEVKQELADQFMDSRAEYSQEQDPADQFMETEYVIEQQTADQFIGSLHLQEPTDQFMDSETGYFQDSIPINTNELTAIKHEVQDMDEGGGAVFEETTCNTDIIKQEAECSVSNNDISFNSMNGDDVQYRHSKNGSEGAAVGDVQEENNTVRLNLDGDENKTNSREENYHQGTKYGLRNRRNLKGKMYDNNDYIFDNEETDIDYIFDNEETKIKKNVKRKPKEKVVKINEKKNALIQKEKPVLNKRQHSMVNKEQNCLEVFANCENNNEEYRLTVRKHILNKRKHLQGELTKISYGFKKEVTDYLLNEYNLAQWPAPYRMQFFANECNRLFNCNPKVTLEDIKKWFSSKRRCDRTRLTSRQIAYLNSMYRRNKIPDTLERQTIASKLNVPVRKVSRWFYKMRENDELDNTKKSGGQLEFTKDGKLKKYMYSDVQKEALLALYEKEKYPSSAAVQKISQDYMIPEISVKSWFTVRRFKERTEKRYFPKKMSESNNGNLQVSHIEQETPNALETVNEKKKTINSGPGKQQCSNTDTRPDIEESTTVQGANMNGSSRSGESKNNKSEKDEFSPTQLEILQSFLNRYQVPNVTTMNALASDFGTDYSTLVNWFEEHKRDNCNNVIAKKRRVCLLTDKQKEALQTLYNKTQNPTKKVLHEVSLELGLSLEKVNNYFKNKRINERRRRVRQRMVLSPEQRSVLLKFYKNNSLPNKIQITQISSGLRLPVNFVNRWFIRQRMTDKIAVQNSSSQASVGNRSQVSNSDDNMGLQNIEDTCNLNPEENDNLISVTPEDAYFF